MATQLSPIKAFVLGVIQGVTEFLPVSSDGHLALGQKILKTGGELELTVMLHLGTLLATILFFYKDILRLLEEFVAVVKDPSRLRRDPRSEELGAIVIASVPTAIIGLALHHTVDRWSKVLWIVGVCFLLTGGVLAVTRYASAKVPWNWTWWRAALVGVAQGLAVLPGLSRSASTLGVAMLLGAPSVDAFRFSFLLSIPAVGGALLLELVKGGGFAAAGGMLGLFGALVAFGVGCLALYLLRKVVSRGALWQFALYVVPLALVTTIVGFFV